jgi:hypothetical protein
MPLNMHLQLSEHIDSNGVRSKSTAPNARFLAAEVCRQEADIRITRARAPESGPCEGLLRVEGRLMDAATENPLHQIQNG